MKRLKNWIQKNRTTSILFLLILIIGLFMRSYRIVEHFEFAHDGDLYSWFVKDVVVDHHVRLIGQLTSAPGIFIGPAFYYALIPFFILFNMDPIGGTLMITLLALATITSYFYIFSKIANYKVGLAIAFLQAILLNHARFDRAVVPTTPTHIWSVWYFYCLVQISRRKYRVALPLLGFLIGFIWHLHIALLPALLSIPVAFFISKKMPSKKDIMYFFATLFIISLPLILFETRHGFSQTLSFIANFSEDHGGAKGLYKLQLVLLMIAKNITNLFLYPQSTSTSITFQVLFTISIIITSIILLIKKILPIGITILSTVWIIGMIVFFSVSSTPISEYYFSNFEVFFLLVAALLITTVFNQKKFGKYLVFIFLGTIISYNLYGLFVWSDTVAGYVSRKAAIDFIRADMTKNNYPCMSLNYITIQGENVGFRYFLWRNKIQVVKATDQIPNYQIVLPAGMSNEVTFKNGLVGVIPPTSKYVKPDNLSELCGDGDLNVEGSMFGFVK